MFTITIKNTSIDELVKSVGFKLIIYVMSSPFHLNFLIYCCAFDWTMQSKTIFVIFFLSLFCFWFIPLMSCKHIGMRHLMLIPKLFEFYNQPMSILTKQENGKKYEKSKKYLNSIFLYKNRNEQEKKTHTHRHTNEWNAVTR